MSSYYDTSGGQVRLIPGAGTYLQDQAKAQSAYERAKASLMAQRQQKQITSGMNQNWEVDPNAQYGTYQQMLQTQGSQLNQAQEQAQERGFFGPGLGNQGESALRYGQAVENLGFKNSLMDFENLYQTSMGDIERQKQEADLAALQGAANDAYGDWTPPNYEDYPAEPDYPYPTEPQAPIAPKVTPKKPAPKPAPKPSRPNPGTIPNQYEHGRGGPVPKPAPKKPTNAQINRRK